MIHVFLAIKWGRQGRTWAILKNTHLVNAGGSLYRVIRGNKPIIGGPVAEAPRRKQFWRISQR